MRAKPPDAPLRCSAVTDLGLLPFLPPTFDVGCSMLDVRCSPPAPRSRAPITNHWSLITEHLPLAPRHWPLITDHSPPVRYPSPHATCHLPLLLCLLLLTLATGCRLVQTATNMPGQAVRAVTPGNKGKHSVDP